MIHRAWGKLPQINFCSSYSKSSTLGAMAIFLELIETLVTINEGEKCGRNQEVDHRTSIIAPICPANLYSTLHSHQAPSQAARTRRWIRHGPFSEGIYSGEFNNNLSCTSWLEFRIQTVITTEVHGEETSEERASGKWSFSDERMKEDPAVREQRGQRLKVENPQGVPGKERDDSRQHGDKESALWLHSMVAGPWWGPNTLLLSEWIHIGWSQRSMRE